MAIQQETEPVAAAGVVEQPRQRARPPVVTLFLVAANLLMALAQVAAAGYQWSAGSIGNSPVYWALGAKVPSLIQHGEYWRLVTANFLHGDWLHLASNVVGLILIGRLIETFYGPVRMLVIYVMAAVAGAAASYHFSLAVSLGASTGVLGLVGALLAHNLKYRNYLPERINRIYPVLLVIVGVMFLFDLARSGVVDVWGHLGGLIGGAVVAGLLESRIAGPLQNDRDWLPLPAALAFVMALLGYGAYGLVAALPGEMDLLRAGRATHISAHVRYIEQAVERRPHFTEARIYLGNVFLRLRRPQDAVAQYELARKANPALVASQENREAMAMLAESHLQQAVAADQAKRWDEALEHYRAIMDLKLDDRLRATAYNNYAWILVDKLNRDLETAEQHALTANRMAPDTAAFVDTLAWVYYKRGRYREALKEQQRAVKLAEAQRDNSAMAELYYHLGAIYEKTGDTDKAIENYARSLRADSSFTQAADGLKRLARPGPRQRGVGELI
jgi:rhomboid protease GluP